MAYGGEQTISPVGYSGAAGRSDEPMMSKLGRILPLRYQITASEQMAPADTTVLTINTQKLTIPAATIRAGDRLKVKAWGKVTNQNSTDTITSLLRLNGTGNAGATQLTLASVVAYDAATSDIHELEAELFFETLGTFAVGKLHSKGKSWRTGGSDARTHVVDSTTISLLTAITVEVGQQWNVNNANNRFKLYELEAVLFRTRQAWG